MQTITLKIILDGIVGALANGQLGAQRGHTYGAMQYPDGARCAIGACLEPDTVTKLLHAGDGYEAGFNALVSLGLIEFEGSPEERMFAISLQSRHDAWAMHHDKVHRDLFLARVRQGYEKLGEEPPKLEF